MNLPFSANSYVSNLDLEGGSSLEEEGWCWHDIVVSGGAARTTGAVVLKKLGERVNYIS